MFAHLSVILFHREGVCIPACTGQESASEFSNNPPPVGTPLETATAADGWKLEFHSWITFYIFGHKNLKKINDSLDCNIQLLYEDTVMFTVKEEWTPPPVRWQAC